MPPVFPWYRVRFGTIRFICKARRIGTDEVIGFGFFLICKWYVIRFYLLPLRERAVTCWPRERWYGTL